jgi:hypothetical protein
MENVWFQSEIGQLLVILCIHCNIKHMSVITWQQSSKTVYVCKWSTRDYPIYKLK